MYKLFLISVILALCLIACECSGGFEDDGAGADDIGPWIFGTDTTK